MCLVDYWKRMDGCLNKLLERQNRWTGYALNTNSPFFSKNWNNVSKEILVLHKQHDDIHIKSKGKGKWVPQQNRCCQECSRRFRLGPKIFMTFGTWRWWSCQPHAPATFTSKECSRYSFSLGIESTPGSRYGRKENVTEKFSDTGGNRSRDRPTSSEAL